MIRRVCTLASLLALLLQGSAGGHMALVEHTRCHEHGELVHGPHEHGLSLDARVGVAAIEGRTNSSPHDGCRHCELSANRRDAATPLTAAHVAETSLVSDADAPSVHLRVPFEAERHRLAPKTSPPA